MVYIIKNFFDNMYFKCLVISLPSKKSRNLFSKTLGFYLIELHLITVKGLVSLR